LTLAAPLPESRKGRWGGFRPRATLYRKDRAAARGSPALSPRLRLPVVPNDIRQQLGAGQFSVCFGGEFLLQMVRQLIAAP
jgi:hypothetical protein